MHTLLTQTTATADAARLRADARDFERARMLWLRAAAGHAAIGLNAALPVFYAPSRGLMGSEELAARANAALCGQKARGLDVMVPPADPDALVKLYLDAYEREHNERPVMSKPDAQHPVLVVVGTELRRARSVHEAEMALIGAMPVGSEAKVYDLSEPFVGLAAHVSVVRASA